jgi:hypothetical protein
MRVLFASDYPHIPENTGGTEINTHELSLALLDAGHEPIVLATLVGHGWVGLRARLKLKLHRGGGWAEDGGLGYRVLRAWNPSAALAGIISHYRPDVVVVQSWRLDMVETALGLGCGVILYCHSANSVYTDTIGGDWMRRCLLLANSRFNARFQGAALGAPFDVLHPIVRPELYRAASAGSRGSGPTSRSPWCGHGRDCVHPPRMRRSSKRRVRSRTSRSSRRSETHDVSTAWPGSCWCRATGTRPGAAW